MLKKLYPSIYIKSIYHLPLKELKEKNIKALFFDIDNTIVPYHITKIDQKMLKHFKALKEMGFIIYLISNNTKKRIESFMSQLDVDAIYFACKPGTKKLIKALREIGVDNRNAAIIGDQIFTDVWCGNRAGLYTILVEPVSKKDQLPTKVKRGLEKWIIKLYLKSIPKKDKKTWT